MAAPCSRPAGARQTPEGSGTQAPQSWHRRKPLVTLPSIIARYPRRGRARASGRTLAGRAQQEPHDLLPSDLDRMRRRRMVPRDSGSRRPGDPNDGRAERADVGDQRARPGHTAIITQVSQITGRPFVSDPRIKGTVTVPGLQDRRHLDAARHHVLGWADAGTVSRQGRHHLAGERPCVLVVIGVNAATRSTSWRSRRCS